jgi:hypothetical protein
MMQFEEINESVMMNSQSFRKDGASQISIQGDGSFHEPRVQIVENKNHQTKEKHDLDNAALISNQPFMQPEIQILVDDRTSSFKSK